MLNGPSPATEFLTFIPESKELKADAIRTAGFAAAPLPELISGDEISALDDLIGGGPIRLWSYGYAQEPYYSSISNVEDLIKATSDYHYNNMLVSFVASEVRLWLPAEHEFFVIFAVPATLEKIMTANIFTYAFSEYLREEWMSDLTRELLKKIKQQYTIGPDRC